MAVYDLWHKSPQPGDGPCDCGTKRRPLYPSARHEQGLRWQVRWRDLDGRQQKKSFARKAGDNPDVSADAFGKMIAERLRTKTYVDPALAETTFQAYAETWRKGRGHDVNRAAWVERQLRNHAYPDPDAPARTPMGGVPVGQHSLGLLAARPSLTMAWITAMPLADGSKLQVIEIASAVYRSAMDDGIIGKDPTRAASVTRPSPGPTKARPWPAQRVAAVRGALPPRFAIVPELLAGTGMRQGEMLGLAVDDISFLARRPVVSVARQVKLIGGQLRFGPVKNRKPHQVPLAPSLALALSRYMEAFPPRDVTLPWHDPRDKERHGQPATLRLVLTGPHGGPVRAGDFRERVWRQALIAAGVTPTRQDGCHALRHTAASVWLRNRVDVVRVAAWLGDTAAMVTKTYAHLLPDDDDSDGRAAMDAFLASCDPDVPHDGDSGAPAQAGR